jgi:hypothetical protein
VAPLGGDALQAVLRRKGKAPDVRRWRGSINPIGGVLVAPLLEPFFVRQFPAWEATFQADMGRVARYVAGQAFVPPEEAPGRQTLIAQDLATLRQGLELLRPATDIAFDVETVGLGPTHTSLVCFALSDGITTLVVPWSRGRDGRVPWWERASEITSEVSLLFADRVTVTHNGPAFDHIVAGRYGIKIGRWEDTLLATNVVASHMPKGLSMLVQSRLDVTAWKEQEDRTADLPRLWQYNARDTLYTALAWQSIKPELGLSGCTAVA